MLHVKDVSLRANTKQIGLNATNNWMTIRNSSIDSLFFLSFSLHWNRCENILLVYRAHHTKIPPKSTREPWQFERALSLIVVHQRKMKRPITECHIGRLYLALHCSNVWYEIPIQKPKPRWWQQHWRRLRRWWRREWNMWNTLLNCMTLHDRLSESNCHHDCHHRH